MRRTRLRVSLCLFLGVFSALAVQRQPARASDALDDAYDAVDELAGGTVPPQSFSLEDEQPAKLDAGKPADAGAASVQPASTAAASTLLGTTTLGCPCQSGSPCDCPCDCYRVPVPVDPYCRHFPQDGFLRIRGWLDAGILGNTSNPASHFNGPYNSQEVDNGQFNQAYLIIDRALDADGAPSIGGRFDLLYGSDYNVAQSNGLERNSDGSPRWNSSQYYGLALPQAYLEAGTTSASVKLGHFYTIVGYESVQSANNFFYSHAYSYQFAGPFTQWGGLANWQPNANWQTQFGLVNGWNTLDGSPNRVNFLGNIKYTSDDQSWWSSFAIITGDQTNNAANLPNITPNNANRTRYSFLVSKQLGSRTEYVFHQWAGARRRANPAAEPPAGTASTNTCITA